MHTGYINPLNNDMKQIIIGILGSLILFLVNSFLGVTGPAKDKDIIKVKSNMDSLPMLHGDTLTWQIKIIDSSGNMFLFKKVVDRFITEKDSGMLRQEAFREFGEMIKKIQKDNLR